MAILLKNSSRKVFHYVAKPWMDPNTRVVGGSLETRNLQLHHLSFQSLRRKGRGQLIFRFTGEVEHTCFPLAEIKLPGTQRPGNQTWRSKKLQLDTHQAPGNPNTLSDLPLAVTSRAPIGIRSCRMGGGEDYAVLVPRQEKDVYS